MNIILQDRDLQIFNQITKYRFLLSRHIKILCNFSSQRTCDRRLKKLIDNGLIKRQYYLYGFPAVYFTTGKAKKLFDLEYITKSVRIEQLSHDISIIDTAIYLIYCVGLNTDDIITERQLKHSYGFASTRHTPDLICSNVCYEIELNQKTFDRLERNIKDNAINYDKQIWIVPKDKTKITDNLSQFTRKYDLEIYQLEVIKDFVKAL